MDKYRSTPCIYKIYKQNIPRKTSQFNPVIVTSVSLWGQLLSYMRVFLLQSSSAYVFYAELAIKHILGDFL
jgi:hypothetical protein